MTFISSETKGWIIASLVIVFAIMLIVIFRRQIRNMRCIDRPISATRDACFQLRELMRTPETRAHSESTRGDSIHYGLKTNEEHIEPHIS